MRFNRKTFFLIYRNGFGDLDQEQVDGLEFLLGKLESDAFSLKQAAYVLATIDHETAHTFQPIMERRERASSPRRKNQDRYWLTGFQGRGYVQITWDYNYEKFGIDDTPEKALEPETAYMIVSKGMRQGMFTGKKLSDYINGKADYRNARKIVNGLDKADQIAANARKFEAILESAIEDETVAPVEEIKETAQPPAKAGESVPNAAATPGEAVIGGRPQDPPKQVTTGGGVSRIVTGLGGIGGICAAVGGFIKGNSGIIIVSILCVTALILVFMFRQIIMDYVRMKLGASPDKYNVR